jgi:hypothetical protein
MVLAAAYFLAGFFFDGRFALALVAVTTIAIAAETIFGYRSDVAVRDAVVGLRRELFMRDQEAAARLEQARRDLDALAADACALAAVPALLAAQLAVLGPALADLLATASAARRRDPLARLELAVVDAARDLVSVAHDTRGRAVLYRRAGGGFEPVSWSGAWVGEPARVGRRSAMASELRGVLASPEATIRTLGSTSRTRGLAQVPLRAGRRQYGVLWVEKADQPLQRQEVEALGVIASILTAAASACDGDVTLPCGPVPPELDAQMGVLRNGGRLVRGSLRTQLAELMPPLAG